LNRKRSTWLRERAEWACRWQRQHCSSRQTRNRPAGLPLSHALAFSPS
jgi:hypothetical protein